MNPRGVLGHPVQFSIITPSFRSSQWLKLCIPSVADQEGVSFEHIVQDSVSDDGTLDWLPMDDRVSVYIEKDKGMYDAVNRGLRKAKGEILAYINCDEQYLPGALKVVYDYFQAHPKVEIAFADTVVVNSDGSFNCFRKVHIPSLYYTYIGDLPTLTSSMFFRRSVIDKYGHFFDDSWRDLGDSDWVARALVKKIPMGLFRHYTSIFTETGENMNLKPNALRERREFAKKAPVWIPKMRKLLQIHYKSKRWIGGGLKQAPFSYSIYTQSTPNQRTVFEVPNPSPYWVRPAPQAS